MKPQIAVLSVILAGFGSSATWADVTTGTAASVPSYQARGATTLAAVGPLAPSLQGKPLVVRIHADWCPACKATQATIDDLNRAYAGQINFVQFDLTNAKTAQASQAQAEALGLEKFYEATKAATSTVAVIGPKDGKIYAMFYNDSSISDYKAAVDVALRAQRN